MANAPSEWNAFQSLLQNAFNKIVRNDFADTIPEDFGTDPESTLKNLLLIKAKDSQSMVTLKVLVFFAWRLYQKVDDLIDRFDTWSDVEDRPYIKIVLKEVAPFKVPDLPRYPEYQFRLNLDTADITPAEFERLASKVKAQFPSSYRFSAGPQKFHYLNPKIGYRNFIYAQNATEAIDLMKRLLKVQDHSFDDQYWSHKGQAKFRTRTVRYKGSVHSKRTRLTQVMSCAPYKAILYPGSGIKPEVLTYL